MSPRLLNSISSRICLQNTQFNMDTIASKQQEGFTFKNSHPKCFITTNSIARLSPGAVNRGEVFRACFRNFQLCFHLNFYTSIKLIFYTKHKKIVNRKGAVYSLCKMFHPKCFKTTNFDGFRQGVGLRNVFQISCQIPNFNMQQTMFWHANLKSNM